MTLARRLVWFRWGTWLALLLLAFALIDLARALWFLPVVVGLAWVGSSWATQVVAALLAQRAFRRFGRLLDAEAFAAAHQLLGELREVYARSHRMVALLRLNGAIVLSVEGRHEEACSVYESIDAQLLGDVWRPWLLNNFAWALASIGQGERAVRLARQSIEASERAERTDAKVDDLQACQLGTLGASLVVVGEPEEAIPFLERALSRGGRPHHQAARAFYLGEALRALGRREEALNAFQRAVEVAPSTEYGKRARTQLDAPSPAYR